jgi:hypothetical protein
VDSSPRLLLLFFSFFFSSSFFLFSHKHSETERVGETEGGEK